MGRRTLGDSAERGVVRWAWRGGVVRVGMGVSSAVQVV